MPFNSLIKSDASMFCFAHQDDEFAIFQQIQASIRSGKIAYCIFTTNSSEQASAVRRNLESTLVLASLGVDRSWIFFPGTDLKIEDGYLYRNIAAISLWIGEFIDSHPEINSSYIPAWEGGHPDHDILHAVTLLALKKSGRPIGINQFPIYNNYLRRRPFFRMLSPLVENGPAKRYRISMLDRVRHLICCLKYRSQWRSWIGLYPYLIFHYIKYGYQSIQCVDLERITKKPHSGPLYYEVRGFFTWNEMIKVINSLLKLK